MTDFKIRLVGPARKAMAARVAKSYNAGTKTHRIAVLLGLSPNVATALLGEIREGKYEGIELKER